MSKKQTTHPEYQRVMTFTQNNKPTNTVSMEKNTNYSFTFFEKTQKKRSVGSKFENKLQTAISGTKHTVTTDKKTTHRKLISNPLPFQSAVIPTKQINTRMTAATEKPSCSKAGEQATCCYRRKEPPKHNPENSADWLKRMELPRNERRQFTSSNKSAGNPMDLDLSIVSENDFQCYNTAEGKSVR